MVKRSLFVGCAEKSHLCGRSPLKRVRTAYGAWRWNMKCAGIVIAVLLFSGCRASQKPASENEEGGAPLSAHQAVDASSPAAKSSVLKGKVLERLDADRYSYLRISTSSGEIWAAVLRANVKVGDEVSVVSP